MASDTTFLALETHVAGLMTSVSKLAIEAFIVAPITASVTLTSLEIHSSGEPKDTQVTAVYVEAFVSLDQILTASFHEGEEFPSSTVERIEEIDLPETQDRELNPFRPDIPSEIMNLGPVKPTKGGGDGTKAGTMQIWNQPADEELPPEKVEAPRITFDYMRQQAEVLRETHMLNQAGDSTFPWEVLTKPHTDRQFRLGALGRFYHDDHGIIMARYVQFKYMRRDTRWVNAPVGFITRPVPSESEWVVTNDLSRSHPDLVVGIMSGFTHPQDGQYGFVIVNGPNLTNLNQTTNAPLPVGTPVVWGANDKISPNSPGRVLGRIHGKNGTYEVKAGTLWVEIESFSQAQIEGWFEGAFVEIAEALTDLYERVDVLDTRGLSSNITAIQRAIADIQKKLAQEIKARAVADQRIRDDFDTQGDWQQSLAALNTALRALITENRGQLDNVDSALGQRLATLESALANAGLATIANELNNIRNEIVAVSNRIDNLPKRVLPVVLGTIPAEFLVDDFGNLIYVEIE